MPALKGHSSIKINSECIMVFGGYNQLGQITETCVLIDLGSKMIFVLKWNKFFLIEHKTVSNFETKGKKPSARAFHVIWLKPPVESNYLFGRKW